MAVSAYSGVANPLRIYSSGEDSFVFPLNATTTKNYNITLSDNGVIQGFLATVNISAFSVAGPGGTITCKLKRNGETLHTSSVDLATFDTAFEVGIVYSESLSFLSGAEVKAGEVFQLNIVCTTVGTTVTTDLRINMVTNAVSRSFQVPD